MKNYRTRRQGPATPGIFGYEQTLSRPFKPGQQVAVSDLAEGLDGQQGKVVHLTPGQTDKALIIRGGYWDVEFRDKWNPNVPLIRTVQRHHLKPVQQRVNRKS